ncbi:MAG: hypothetical protein KAJ14_08560, partial [Candidatus Omnitrophica bacterium]|nr:hypothetical protein [Candidatus Omnitrophota bacterium]
SAKNTADICRYRCSLAVKLVPSVKFTHNLVTTSLIQYSPHLTRKNLIYCIAGIKIMHYLG